MKTVSGDKFDVIIYDDKGASYLSHRGRSEWCYSQARKHRADILAGRTGIKGFNRVIIWPTGKARPEFQKA